MCVPQVVDEMLHLRTMYILSKALKCTMSLILLSLMLRTCQTAIFKRKLCLFHLMARSLMLQKMKQGRGEDFPGLAKERRNAPGDPQEPRNDQTDTEPALHSPEEQFTHCLCLEQEPLATDEIPFKESQDPRYQRWGDPWGCCGSENKDSRNEMITIANQSYSADLYLKAARGPYSQLLLLYHNEDPGRD